MVFAKWVKWWLGGVLFTVVWLGSPPPADASTTSEEMAHQMVVAQLLAEMGAVHSPGHLELEVPWVNQIGEVTNCGPSAAAMVIGAYRSVDDLGVLRGIRDAVGEWSWDEFPLRRLAFPGYDAGMSTPLMMKASLNRFGGGDVRFDLLSHPWLPEEAYAIAALHANLEQGRPLIALVQASTLWENGSPALHWVVIRGIKGDRIVFNDSADTGRMELPMERFLDAWRLNPFYQGLPTIGPYTALVPSRPLPALAAAVNQYVAK